MRLQQRKQPTESTEPTVPEPQPPGHPPDPAQHEQSHGHRIRPAAGSARTPAGPKALAACTTGLQWESLPQGAGRPESGRQGQASGRPPGATPDPRNAEGRRRRREAHPPPPGRQRPAHRRTPRHPQPSHPPADQTHKPESCAKADQPSRPAERASQADQPSKPARQTRQADHRERRLEASRTGPRAVRICPSRSPRPTSRTSP